MFSKVDLFVLNNSLNKALLHESQIPFPEDAIAVASAMPQNIHSAIQFTEHDFRINNLSIKNYLESLSAFHFCRLFSFLLGISFLVLNESNIIAM